MATKEKIDWPECQLVEAKPGVHRGAHSARHVVRWMHA
jgi:hypothetical protein